MKTITRLTLSLCALAAISCGQKKEAVNQIYTLKNDAGMELKITNDSLCSAKKLASMEEMIT